MISGAVTFDEIVTHVKDETGITNMRPLYDKIRRLIFRAEREIGYGGSIVLKRCLYKKDENGFNGTYLKYPDDMIELEGIGQADHGKYCISFYHEVNFGIRLKESQTDVVLLYWGLSCDGWGNPITTRNHEEAIVAYIVWKLYSAKRFLDQGNANTSYDYERRYTSQLLEARGDDAFPTLEEFDQIALLSYADRRGLLQFPTASYTYCDNGLLPQCCGETTPEPEPVNTKVHYWQLDNVVDDFNDVYSSITQPLIDSKPFQPLSSFEAGYTVAYTLIGRICFLIQSTTSLSWEITDILGNNVTSQFDFVYDNELQYMLFVSKEIYTHSSIFFKFKDLS